MDALILSCSTGGGHNAAGRAVKEELERRGHHAAMLDPYSLAGHHWDDRVAQGYVRMVQKTPRLFGGVYQLGDLYRQLPVHSPVYEINQTMCQTMERYLNSHHYDVVLMPHIYPAEILTCMKNRGMAVPKTIFIATDYVCIPFTEEVDCDYYITPGESLNADFVRWGIPAEKLVPAGIPVRSVFYRDISGEDAKAMLGLDQDKKYLLLSGGSIGAGDMVRAIAILRSFMNERPDYRLIVVCGSNKTLQEGLEGQWGGDERIQFLSSTPQIDLYMRACQCFLSKPGGLSSTEAAVLGTPLIHLSPIPGCENRNLDFFGASGMSLPVGDQLHLLPDALELLEDELLTADLKENQRRIIPRSAAKDICDLAERITM